MSQGMNNNSLISLVGNAQDLELCQMLISLQQQSFNKAFQNPEFQQLFQTPFLPNLTQSLNLNNSSKDAYLTPNILNMNSFAKTMELIQCFSNPTHLLQQANFLNHYPLQQMNFNQKQKNNADNPITVDDDEPIQQQKKCHNPQCKNVGDKKIKSKRNDILFFCDKCSKLYNKGNYCDFCEQVYGSYDDEAGWIQCDSCQKWNHIACEQKNRNQNIQIEFETSQYHCLTCSKNVKKPKAPKKIEEPPVLKQRPIIEQEDVRNREKNITFVATKDNKIQYTFRFNLIDDEIKQDLDLLRNSNKKKQKIQQSSPPKIQQIIQTQQQNTQQQQQQPQQEESSFANRNLRRRINQKINYRDLIGEYYQNQLKKYKYQMLKLQEKRKLMEILNNPNSQFNRPSSRNKSRSYTQPIEQLIFNRSLLRVYGHQKFQTQQRNTKKFNLKKLEITQLNQNNKQVTDKLNRDYSTKSNDDKQSPLKKEKLEKRCSTTTNNRFYQINYMIKDRRNTNISRVVEEQNDSQKQRYQMLHLNFIKTQKQYQNIYGIPISEFLLEHKFLTLIHQQILILLLMAFSIDCTNIYEVITFKQYKLFKQVIIWKDLSIIDLVDKISSIFQNASGGDLLNIIHLIPQIQPYKYNGKQKLIRDMNLINKTVQDLEHKFIEHVLQQGNLNIQIDITKFKKLFYNQIIYINTFIDLLSGQF